MSQYATELPAWRRTLLTHELLTESPRKDKSILSDRAHSFCFSTLRAYEPTELNVFVFNNRTLFAISPQRVRRAIPVETVFAPGPQSPAPSAAGRAVRGQVALTCSAVQRKTLEAYAMTSSVKNNPGNDLLSHGFTPEVPSAEEGLTAVFGMGTGVSPLL